MTDIVEQIVKNPITVLAKKEIMDNIRNKWVIVITIIFVALTLLASYAGSLSGGGWQDLAGTVNAMSTLVQYLISIIALILGYAAIIGEIEKGSMNSLLSFPTSRWEVLLGKFIGLGIVLSISIFIGFSFAGIIIGLNVGNVNYAEYLFFIAASIFMGLIFLNIGLFLSTVLKKRSSSMGAAIFIWVFFGIIWIFIVTAIIIASGTLEQDIENPNDFELPDAVYMSNFFNPLSSYSAYLSFNMESLQSSQFDMIGFIDYPDYYNSTSMLISMIVWFSWPLAIAFWRFEKREI